MNADHSLPREESALILGILGRVMELLSAVEMISSTRGEVNNARYSTDSRVILTACSRW